MEESQKQFDDNEDQTQIDRSPTKVVIGEFEQYLINALNESLIKKSKLLLQ